MCRRSKWPFLWLLLLSCTIHIGFSSAYPRQCPTSKKMCPLNESQKAAIEKVLATIGSFYNSPGFAPRDSPVLRDGSFSSNLLSNLTAETDGGHQCHFAEEDYLVCDGASVTAFPGDEIPSSLEILLVNGTGIDSLGGSVLAGKSVRYLTLESNEALTAIDPDAFEGVEDVAYLRLSGSLDLDVQQHQREGRGFFEVFAPLGEYLTYLVLDGNGFNLTGLGIEVEQSALVGQTDSFQCLEHLSLKGNQLGRLEEHFFGALTCSPLKELYLQSADLSTIHPGKMFSSFTDL